MYRFKYPLEKWDESDIDKRIIRDLIAEHQNFTKDKLKCIEYYEGLHSIANRTKDNSQPNNKVVCNHAKNITDTAVGYFMGSPITYKNTDKADIEDLLLAFDDANVDDVDHDNAHECSIFGLTYEYVYRKKDTTEPVSKNISMLEAFIIVDDTIEENKLAGVYYYNKRDDAQKKDHWVAMICTENYLYENIPVVPDASDSTIDVDPKPHMFGAVPMIEILNNKEGIGDFEQQISLIDAYETLMSDRVNDKEQFVDSILAIYGAILGDDTAETKEALAELKRLKLLELPIDAKAEYLNRQMDENGVETLRKAIQEDIYTFSHVPNLTDDNFSGNASGVALEYKLLGLEMLTKVKERQYRKALRERILLYANAKSLTAIAADAGSIVPQFSRGLPKNLVELAQIVSVLDGKVSTETLLGLLPFVEDPAGEVEAVEEEKEASAERQQAMFGLRPNTFPSDEEEPAEERTGQTETIVDRTEEEEKKKADE